MKFLFSTALIFYTAFSVAQKTETYYDYKWNVCDIADARFISIVQQVDSLWQRNDFYIRERRLQMTGSYKEKECRIKHGMFSYYHSNGRLESEGIYANNQQQGLWLGFHDNGMMKDSVNYENGKAVGTELKWFPNGYMSDSNVYNPGGKDVRVAWFDNGQLSSAGYLINKKQHGKWQYFHRNGQLSAEEVFDQGKLISRFYYEEDGTTLRDDTEREREATCKKDWKEWLSNHLYFPSNVKIVNADKATVVVDFVIDEDGNVSEAHIYSSFHPMIDNAALGVIRNSPKWNPAIDHNRRVKAYRRQPMTFTQSE